VPLYPPRSPTLEPAAVSSESSLHEKQAVQSYRARHGLRLVCLFLEARNLIKSRCGSKGLCSHCHEQVGAGAVCAGASLAANRGAALRRRFLLLGVAFVEQQNPIIKCLSHHITHSTDEPRKIASVPFVAIRSLASAFGWVEHLFRFSHLAPGLPSQAEWITQQYSRVP
jgi:hypothetical protein